jgi:hypothetical protein
MADTEISKPISMLLQQCEAFLEEVSKGERRTTLTHAELMLIATYLRQTRPDDERGITMTPDHRYPQ